MELPPQKIAGRLKQPLLVKGRRKTAVDIALASAVERGPSRGVPDFLVTNGLPEMAEDGTGRATESRFGIKFIQHQNKEHPEKLLEYETEQLERDPFSIILDTTRRASVLAMPHVLGSMARCAVTSLAAIAASLVMEDEVIHPNPTLTRTLTLTLTLTRKIASCTVGHPNRTRTPTYP